MLSYYFKSTSFESVKSFIIIIIIIIIVIIIIIIIIIIIKRSRIICLKFRKNNRHRCSCMPARNTLQIRTKEVLFK